MKMKRSQQSRDPKGADGNLKMKPTKLFCLILLLMFITVGCKKRAVKPTEPADSLHKVVAGGNIDQIKSLISRGADVNVKDNQGQTPSSLAAEEAHNQIVELLRKHGAKESTKLQNCK